MRRALAAAVAALVASIAACAPQHTEHGVIFTKAQTAAVHTGEFPDEFGPPFRTPSAKTVAEAETRLAGALSEDPAAQDVATELRRYGRQYLGVTSKGRRILEINGFCQPAQFPDWGHEYVAVVDGGRCFFHAFYSPETKRFVEVSVNGDA